ncbi:hypothetical protein CEXT_754081 [Caerostris extrusa]|uniref:Uncharacterized protein n=1 Tax=Caerostris extrusa TaxID=172846 RepID=A0AAV4Q211_CAEEX|nr:hypothetical protein CEXT_754081 [Caerostris extrusa]
MTKGASPLSHKSPLKACHRFTSVYLTKHSLVREIKTENLARVIRLLDATIIEHVSLPEHRNLENFNCLNYHRKTILFVDLLAFDCFRKLNSLQKGSPLEYRREILSLPEIRMGCVFGIAGVKAKLDGCCRQGRAFMQTSFIPNGKFPEKLVMPRLNYRQPVRGGKHASCHSKERFGPSVEKCGRK